MEKVGVDEQLLSYRRFHQERLMQSAEYLERKQRQELEDLQYAKKIELEQKLREEQQKWLLKEDEELARKLQQEAVQIGNPRTNSQLQTNLRTVSRQISFPSSPTSITSNDEEIAKKLQQEEIEEARQSILQRESAGLNRPIENSRHTANNPTPLPPVSVRDNERDIGEEYARTLQSEETASRRSNSPLPFLSFTQHFYQYPNLPNPVSSNHTVSYATRQDESAPPNPSPVIRTVTITPIRELNDSLRRTRENRAADPLISHLRQAMSLHSGARRRVTLSGSSNQNGDELPPQIREMIHGDFPADYESLILLGDVLQPVNRGASEEELGSIPIRKFKEGSLNQEEANCGICLQDYENGEDLLTLPRCLHHFHKSCCEKWLSINKICPVCREHLSGTYSKK